MAVGLLGKKIGMTQWIRQDGRFIPVSCLEIGPCSVLEIKDKSITLGYGDIKEDMLKKPQLGFFKKINLTPKKIIKELTKDAQEYKVGQDIKVDIFQEGEFVDVRGVSIGKGFQGGMKRWNWRGGSRSHGATSHRRVGAIGSSTSPGRVVKGHPLPGHMGAKAVTVQNLRVVKVDKDNNLLLVKGAVPGHKNNILLIRKSKKRPKPQAQQAQPIIQPITITEKKEKQKEDKKEK